MRKAALNLEELQNFAKECAKNIRGGEVIALIGDLGAGKTTFVQALLKARGIKKRVTSPTFSIMRPYTSKNITFYHVDLYRLGKMKEVEALGITNEWQKNNTVFLIEWADKIQRHLPKKTILIKLSKNIRASKKYGGEEFRTISISSIK
jgi:tRNA threonylcarbamoyladenosine biosynthesis protein TsaE